MTKGTCYIFETGRVIYAVFPNPKVAEEIANAAIENRLAACANIFPAHQSIYRWKEVVETATEVAVIFKTIEEKSAALIEFIRKHHSYETPAILEFSVTNSTPDFAAWLTQSCRG